MSFLARHSTSESDTSYETSSDHFPSEHFSPEHFSAEKKSAPSIPPNNQGFFTPSSTAQTPRKDISSLYEDIPITLHQDLPITAANPNTNPKPKPIFQCDNCINAILTDGSTSYPNHFPLSSPHQSRQPKTQPQTQTDFPMRQLHRRVVQSVDIKAIKDIRASMDINTSRDVRTRRDIMASRDIEIRDIEIYRDINTSREGY